MLRPIGFQYLGVCISTGVRSTYVHTMTICLLSSDLQRIGLAWDIPGRKSVSVCMRFEVSTTVNTTIDAFENVALCHLIETCRYRRHGFCSED